MLRITRTEDSQFAVTLGLGGRVADEWAVVADGERSRARHEGEELVLDCAEVTFVDAEWSGMLRLMAKEKVPLAHTPPPSDGLL